MLIEKSREEKTEEVFEMIAKQKSKRIISIKPHDAYEEELEEKWKRIEGNFNKIKELKRRGL